MFGQCTTNNEWVLYSFVVIASIILAIAVIATMCVVFMWSTENEQYEVTTKENKIKG